MGRGMEGAEQGTMCFILSMLVSHHRCNQKDVSVVEMTVERHRIFTHTERGIQTVCLAINAY